MWFPFASKFFCLLGALLLWVGSPTQAQTAHELLVAGETAFSSSDYVRAEQAFSRFLADFGSAAEAATSKEPALRLLAVALVEQGKFEKAIEVMGTYLKSFPGGLKAEDFSFWMGVSYLKTGDSAKAYTFFEAFLKNYPNSPQVQEARFSMGLCLLQQSNFKEVADSFPPLIDGFSPEQRYQARIIRLYALLQMDKLDDAFAVLGEIDPLAEEATKIAAYHVLALDLGNRLLTQEKHRQALSVLQRVWSKTRILTRQRVKLEKIRQQMAGKPNGEAGFYERVRLKDVTAQVEQDLEQLEKIPDYDTALQFRIGQCFFQLERPREAYLSMKEMLTRLPDSDLLASAHYTMLICLTRMQRWDEVLQAAVDFDKRFPKNKEVPDVLYLKAEAYQRQYAYEEAYLTFSDVAKRFPDYRQAPRCHFMAGYSLLMQDKNTQAYDHFSAILKNQPRSPWVEQIMYWQCMALHFARDYEKSRESFANYLKQFPKGVYQVDATFRRAQGLFNQKQFTEAYKELELFLKKYPDAVVYDEACNLLGDCYLALGEADRGLEVYRKISGKDKKLSDYAAFRMGQVYKALENYQAMQAHFQKFINERPDSPRLTEALSQLAWIYRRQEQPEKARDLYWDTLRTHGNNPEASAVEEMMKSLARMYRLPEEKATFQAKLVDLAEDAIKTKQPTLAARAVWIRAIMLEKMEPDLSCGLRLKIPGLAQPRELSAQLLADVGDELRRAQRWDEADTYYKTILSWYPNSMLKGRAYAGLGLVAQEQGKNKEALALFTIFEKESTQSPLLAEVLQNRARLYLERNQYDEAVRELERILLIPTAKGKLWVEALYRIGEIKMKQKDPKRAIPYFQRIYVMYGKWAETVARAYWQSGQAFEQLEMKTEAVNTYREFIGQEHLRSTPEYGKAQERLKQVGGV
jgi:TolA-binding protein